MRIELAVVSCQESVQVFGNDFRTWLQPWRSIGYSRAVREFTSPLPLTPAFFGGGFRFLCASLRVPRGYRTPFDARLPYMHNLAMNHREDVHEIAKTGFGNGTNDLYDRSALTTSEPVGQITHLRSSEHVHRTLLMLSDISVKRLPLQALSTSSSINNSLPSAASVMFNVLLELVLALAFSHVHSSPTLTGLMP